MASVVIHMCVASEVNKKRNVKNYNDFLLGSIAPDISRVVGMDRDLSHFTDPNTTYPDMKKFLKKYGNKLNNDFMLGYFVHLYTDYLWYKYFIRDINYKGLITLTDGIKIDYDENMFRKYLYNDYTNLNIKLIDTYNLDLSLFYNPLVMPDVQMDEIPVNRLQELLDSASIIIENSKVKKDYLFDTNNVKEFVSVSTDLICGEIDKLMS